MAKTVVITQSNYLPWRGYFDLLRSADEVVLLDCVQYTRRDWRNRNRIKTPRGAEWLTIAVETKGRQQQAIDETQIADRQWSRKHIKAIELAYHKAPFYRQAAPWLFDLLQSVADEPLLTKVNERTLRALCQRLNIPVTIWRCSEVIARERLLPLEATERLVALAAALGASRYLTGPAARDYLAVDRFHAAGIAVEWMSYEGYAPYPQLWGAFEQHVSIVDLLLNTGADAPRYLTRQ
jgi:hypothetical protein